MARLCRGNCGTVVVPPWWWCPPCKLGHDVELMAVRVAAHIPSAVRHAVLARDGMVCRHCGKAVRLGVGRRRNNGDVLSFDHFPLPVSKGGKGTVENVVVACMDCNRRRGDRF